MLYWLLVTFDKRCPLILSYCMDLLLLPFFLAVIFLTSFYFHKPRLYLYLSASSQFVIYLLVWEGGHFFLGLIFLLFCVLGRGEGDGLVLVESLLLGTLQFARGFRRAGLGPFEVCVFALSPRVLLELLALGLCRCEQGSVLIGELLLVGRRLFFSQVVLLSWGQRASLSLLAHLFWRLYYRPEQQVVAKLPELLHVSALLPQSSSRSHNLMVGSPTLPFGWLKAF